MDYQIRGKREIAITQYGEAWIDAESEAEALKIAEDDPEGLDWNWDDLDAEDDTMLDTIAIVAVKSGDDFDAETKAEEDEE